MVGIRAGAAMTAVALVLAGCASPDEAAGPEFTPAEASPAEASPVGTSPVGTSTADTDPGTASPEPSGNQDPNWGIPRDENGIITQVNFESAQRDISAPACDGRNILILDSVVADGDVGTTHSKLAFSVVHLGDGNAQYTYPGQCPSLRAQLDGRDIYPVYLDFGPDAAAMCEAKAQYGGNGRVLSNRAEYVDPC